MAAAKPPNQNKGDNTMKYYIVMHNKQLNRTLYKKNKCVDGWTPVKDYCWRFSKQGAKKIIERLKYGYRNNIDNLEFYLEEAE